MSSMPSRHFLGIYSLVAGRRTISLLRKTRVIDLINNKVIADRTDSFTVEMSANESRLFRLGA